MRHVGSLGRLGHKARLSARGAPLELRGRVIDFEVFRPVLDAALGSSDGTKGGRLPHDQVTMLKAAQNNVIDARMKCPIRDRLSWQHLLRFDLAAATPNANTIRPFREQLTLAVALDALFADFDRQLRERGYLPMGGQIKNAASVAAPKVASSPSLEGWDQTGQHR